jgi:hypothetical protein
VTNLRGLLTVHRTDESVEHLLKAIDLVLFNTPTGLQPIAEDRRTNTLPRQLPSAASEHFA